MAATYKLAIVAGEHSGDTHGGNLCQAFNKTCPGTTWFGAGGPVLTSAGVEIVVPMEKLSVVGIGEVVSRLPDLWRGMGMLKKELKERRPDALLLVDFPDFNFRLARFAHRLGIPVVYYITPQVWAWRRGRTKLLQKFVDRAMVIFPFEEVFLKEHGVKAVFVGHPLVDTAKATSSLDAFLGRHSLDAEKKRIALLPGSRNSEMDRILPTMLKAAELLAADRNDLVFLVPLAGGIEESVRERYAHPLVHWISGEYHDVLGHADAAVVASGTATLEAALMGVPSVIVYKINPVTYAVGKCLVKLPHVGLPNVLLGREAIVELIQGDFTADNTAEKISRLVNSNEEARLKARNTAADVRKRLGEGNASVRAAEALLDFLEKRR